MLGKERMFPSEYQMCETDKQTRRAHANGIHCVRLSFYIETSKPANGPIVD